MSYVLGGVHRQSSGVAAVLERNLGEVQKVANGVITAIEDVGDPYADGYGAFAESNPWTLAEDSLLDQEWERRRGWVP